MIFSHHILLVISMLPFAIALETLIRHNDPLVKISTVATGLEALILHDQTGFDLVIITPEAGIIDGLMLTQTLRARSDALPIILISGNLTLEKEANKAGVTLFLCQPEEIAKLKTVLPQLLTPPNQGQMVSVLPS